MPILSFTRSASRIDIFSEQLGRLNTLVLHLIRNAAKLKDLLLFRSASHKTVGGLRIAKGSESFWSVMYRSGEVTKYVYWIREVNRLDELNYQIEFLYPRSCLF